MNTLKFSNANCNCNGSVEFVLVSTPIPLERAFGFVLFFFWQWMSFLLFCWSRKKTTKSNAFHSWEFSECVEMQFCTNARNSKNFTVDREQKKQCKLYGFSMFECNWVLANFCSVRFCYGKIGVRGFLFIVTIFCVNICLNAHCFCEGIPLSVWVLNRRTTATIENHQFNERYKFSITWKMVTTRWYSFHWYWALHRSQCLLHACAVAKKFKSK